MLLRNNVIRGWAKDPYPYSSGITNDAFVMISRTFAPPEQRLKSLIAREKLMPNALAAAHRNMDNPPRVYTEIAIEQVDGNRDFFDLDVPAAFTEAARKIDPTTPPMEVLADVAKDYPPPSELLAVTQSNLDSLAQFVCDKQIIDLPAAPPALLVRRPASPQLIAMVAPRCPKLGELTCGFVGSRRSLI